MKKPDRLIGYLNYNDTYYPFEFDNDNFSITLFPPTLEKWNEMADIRFQFKVMSQYNAKQHKWIKENKLFGITSERNHHLFGERLVP